MSEDTPEQPKKRIPWNKGLKGYNPPGRKSFPKGHVPWNKGLKGIRFSPEGEFKKGQIPWNKGLKGVMKAWNKGLTKEAHPSIARMGFQPGEQCVNWKGGVSSENEIQRKSSASRAWRKAVFERDDHTCQICGIKGGKLNANHIKKFADYPDLRFDPTNGITLCERCHYKQVNHYEEDWESYFNFNLITRGIISDPYVQSFIPSTL